MTDRMLVLTWLYSTGDRAFTPDRAHWMVVPLLRPERRYPGLFYAEVRLPSGRMLTRGRPS